MLTLYDPVTKPKEVSGAVSTKQSPQAVVFEAKSETSTVRRLWFLLETMGALTTRLHSRS